MRAFALALLTCLGLGAGAGAQNLPFAPAQLLTGVLDERRLFAESQFGVRVLRETQAAIDALVAENKVIEAELEADERALADKRGQIPAAEFRLLADAFDARVTAQRQERAGREQAVTAGVQAEERRFQALANEILNDIARDLGLQIIMPAQGLIFVTPEIDITDRVIQRIDARIGDGVPPR